MNEEEGGGRWNSMVSGMWFPGVLPVYSGVNLKKEGADGRSRSDFS